LHARRLPLIRAASIAAVTLLASCASFDSLLASGRVREAIPRLPPSRDDLERLGDAYERDCNIHVRVWSITPDALARTTTTLNERIWTEDRGFADVLLAQRIPSDREQDIAWRRREHEARAQTTVAKIAPLLSAHPMAGVQIRVNSGGDVQRIVLQPMETATTQDEIAALVGEKLSSPARAATLLSIAKLESPPDRREPSSETARAREAPITTALQRLLAPPLSYVGTTHVRLAVGSTNVRAPAQLFLCAKVPGDDLRSELRWVVAIDPSSLAEQLAQLAPLTSLPRRRWLEVTRSDGSRVSAPEPSAWSAVPERCRD
jgi:hypothetical protein